MAEAPDRNLALELVRVTEAGAMAAGRWVGRGDKNGADGAAVNAMRQLISSVTMNGVVVIGEGEKDDAPMLYNGEYVGTGEGALCDVAVDPVDGTALCAKGMTNAIAVMAVAERGTMFDPSAVFYMEKLVTGSQAADVVDITAPAGVNVRAVAKAKGENPEDVTVCILDRPRHDDIVREIRETGARIKFISDGDVAGAIMAAREGTGIDLLLGIGGTPEGIISACAMKCLGGVIQAKLWPRDADERRKALDAGHDLDRVLLTEDLVTSDNVFFVATGITDGELLRGVRYRAGGAQTHSLVMRSRSGTIRLIESEHRLDKLRKYAAVDFEHATERPDRPRMITVCGETVADLVAQEDGDYRAYPGGSPANVALALARLGEETTFAGRLGPDVFGRRIRAHLTSNGVDPRHLVEAAQPSTLAVVSFDEQRRASYDFWTEGTADWQWTDGDLATHPAPGVVALHTGSLASWTPPGDTAIKHLFARARAAGTCTLSYDPNVRPRLLGGADAARSAIEGMVALAHVVKVSDEDLAWLCPGEDVADVARSWVELGPGLVVVTLGPDGSVAARPGRRDLVRRPAPTITLVDTVGAGDTFTSGLLHALAQHDALGPDPMARLGALTDDALGAILVRAARAAALNCTREGCDPPTRAELDAFA